MTSDLEAWAEYHAALFGLTTDRDAEMLLAWVDVFAAAGYDARDLREASQWLAVHNAPRFRSDHLAAIQAQMRDGRARPAAPPEGRGDCALCLGTGRVIVPDPRAQPPHWATCAVLCSCALGAWYAGRVSRDRPTPLTFAAYQAAHPGWRDRLREHDEALRDPGHEAALRRRLQSADAGAARLRPITEAVDRALGRVQARPNGGVS